jgi:hypothetical protein
MPQRLINDLQYELEISRLHSHERHMKYIYGLRLGGLVLSALTIVIGSIMIFFGLQGSFDWAIQAPSSVGAKLTNASPGIVFATVGMFIGLFVILQKPVNYRTGTSNLCDPSRSPVDYRGGEIIGESRGVEIARGDYRGVEIGGIARSDYREAEIGGSRGVEIARSDEVGVEIAGRKAPRRHRAQKS